MADAQRTGPMFNGSIVAIITPFKDGKVDEGAFRKLIDWHIAEGTHGIVPCGTTGESPTLTHSEHMKVTEIAIEQAAKRVPIIAGAGSNSTDEAVRLTRHAAEAGADAALVVTPYYNKPTQEGLYQHYKAVHDAADIPIIIYNIPGRSIVDMSVATMARLAELPNIVGVKDATSDLARPMDTRLAIGDWFTQLSGEDPTTVPFMAMGGHGCISVTANVAPKLCSQLMDAWKQGALETVDQLNKKLMPVHRAMFCETSPGPAKYGVSLLGHCEDEARLPICAISEASKATVRSAMQGAGLLN